jgi:hypothetical protein
MFRLNIENGVEIVKLFVHAVADESINAEIAVEIVYPIY